MTDFKKLREELEQFRSTSKKELELRPIEKWMTNALGVRRIDTGKGVGKKKGKGTTVTYYHPALCEFGGQGFFTVHKQSGRQKKREIISKFDFRKYIYPRLNEILLVMEREAQRDQR